MGAGAGSAAEWILIEGNFRRGLRGAPEGRRSCLQAASDGIFRVWGRGSSPEADVPTELFAGRARELIAAYDPLVDNADIQCRQGMPDTMYDPTFLEITNLGDTIDMHVQEFNIHRTIHMTENDPEPSDAGYSTGRWDGDALIVNTTHVDWPYWSEIPVPLRSGAAGPQPVVVDRGWEACGRSGARSVRSG